MPRLDTSYKEESVWKYHAKPQGWNHHSDEFCVKADSNGIHRAECSAKCAESIHLTEQSDTNFFDLLVRKSKRLEIKHERQQTNTWTRQKVFGDKESAVCCHLCLVSWFWDFGKDLHPGNVSKVFYLQFQADHEHFEFVPLTLPIRQTFSL